jgi:L-ribulokinase
MYTLGIDFGTNSVRCIILNLENGVIHSASAYEYPSGVNGIITDEKNPYLARQNPLDYLISLENVIISTIKEATKDKLFTPEQVIGIGIDSTGSTPLPVDKNLNPLSFLKEFQNNKNCMAYLWKDHTSTEEAEEITSVASKTRPKYLLNIGGAYSSEWFFSKLLHFYRVDKKAYEATSGFIELCDYIPAILCGKKHPSEVVRSICAAGHKAMYNTEWGGLPDSQFLAKFFPSSSNISRFLYQKAYPAGKTAGYLSKLWAGKLGLPPGLPVSVGALDAHIGAVGAGVKPGVLVKVIGTSACDMTIMPESKTIKNIPSICGTVSDSIVPGFTGIEAGQAAVGDIFNWFVKNFVKDTAIDHNWLSHQASKLKPGETGLLSLDWHNGNRNILADQKLTGVILGLTLNTKPEEVYKTLIEATGFGARIIIEQFEKYGVPIKTIVATGGIPDKNPLLMQIYADITGRTLKIADSAQTCALGAAIFGAVVATKDKGGFKDVETAQKKICRFKNIEYKPIKENRVIYNKIYHIYKKLHNSFGINKESGNLYSVMKELLEIQHKIKNRKR